MLSVLHSTGLRVACATSFVLFAAGCQAASAPAPTCEQIREQIKSVTGLPPKINTELLQTLSLRQECQFVAAEVYRAAYGDKPLPKQDTSSRQNSHDEDD